MIDLVVKVKGLDEVKRGLESLPDKIARGVLRKGTLAGAKLIRDRVKIAAPIRREGRLYKKTGRNLASKGMLAEMRAPGYLRSHIGAKYRRQVSTKFTARYGVRPIGPAFYGFFVEGGHKIGKRPSRSIKRIRGDARGSIPAHPFMAPVLRNATSETIEAMKKVFIRGVLKVWTDTGFQGSARP